MINISLCTLTGSSPFLRKPRIFYMSLPKVATLLRVKFTLTLVLLTFSLFYPFTLVVTTRGLALISRGKRGSPFIKVTLTELSISNLRHAFTLK